jgi:signal transduction histidine kinase/ActR/RegA family two-component response regulator
VEDGGMNRLATLRLDREEDVVAARQHARRFAATLGFETQDQTRIATAVSEIARNAVMYAQGGEARFEVSGQPRMLVIEIEDRGGGIPDLDAVLDGSYVSRTGMGRGIAGSRRLMDAFDIDAGANGTRVRLGKRLPLNAPATPNILQHIATEFAEPPAADPVVEVETVNRELLASLSELHRKQDDLERVGSELEDTNRGVVALYAELDERAEQLRQASELKSRFLSNMSHEFRTPLNSVLALSRLLLDRADGPLTDEQERQVRYIRQSAETLTDMVNDLLDLAKVEAGKVDVAVSRFTVGKLFGALRGVMKPLQVSGTVELVFEEDAAALTLATDEGKLAQILRNLVSNALKFTEAGEVRVTASREGENCVFAVRDSGIGIAPEDQERIFQEFAQVRHRLQSRVKGTGLGLPLSRKLAELLGGTLTVASAPGAGSTFTLTIPTRMPGLAESDAGTRSGRPLVLVIDDEEAARYVLRQMVGAGDRYDVIEARGGTEGLQRAEAEHPDLILLDLNMPDLHGEEVLGRLAASPATSDIPVIVCTSALAPELDLTRLGAARALLPKASLTRASVAQALQDVLSAAEHRA